MVEVLGMFLLSPDLPKLINVPDCLLQILSESIKYLRRPGKKLAPIFWTKRPEASVSVLINAIQTPKLYLAGEVWRSESTTT